MQHRRLTDISCGFRLVVVVVLIILIIARDVHLLYKQRRGEGHKVFGRNVLTSALRFVSRALSFSDPRELELVGPCFKLEAPAGLAATAGFIFDAEALVAGATVFDFDFEAPAGASCADFDITATVLGGGFVFGFGVDVAVFEGVGVGFDLDCEMAGIGFDLDCETAGGGFDLDCETAGVGFGFDFAFAFGCEAVLTPAKSRNGGEGLVRCDFADGGTILSLLISVSDVLHWVCCCFCRGCGLGWHCSFG